MTKKVLNGDSLKRQRELSSSNNEKEYERLKKRKSEKLQELFGNATLPDSKIYVTDSKKSSITQSHHINQNTEGDINSNSGIGFLDALNTVTSSGSSKKIKIEKHNKEINEKKQTLFKDDNEKQHTKSYKTDKQKIRTDDDNTKTDSKSLTTKTTTVDLKKHKTKNQSKSTLKKEKVAKTDKIQSKHNQKYLDKKEDSKIAKIIEDNASKKNKSNKPYKHNKNDKKNNKNITKIVDKRNNKYEGKEKSSSENISKRNLANTTEKEISSSSRIGFTEELEMTTNNKSKSKKNKKN